MIRNEHQSLWENVRSFSIDDPSAPYKFSDKLAHQNGWTAGFVSRAIDEYKRFIFLCCISPAGASPSEVVDEVWHLHLTYTHSYWKRFCGETLGKEIHHHPSRGGQSEAARHRQWYSETLILYRDVFDEEPPADIWPPVVTQPFFQSFSPPAYNQAYWKNSYLLLLPFLLPLFFGKLHPYVLNGPQFLLFYALLLIAAVILLLKIKTAKRKLLAQQVNAAGISHANPYQLARYVYGRNKAVETAVVDAVSKGILVAERNGKLEFHPSKMTEPDKDENPLVATLAVRYRETQLLTMKDVEACYQSNTTQHEGLQNLYQNGVKKDYIRFVVLALVVTIGLFRIRQGLGNHQPVAYLEIMTMIGGLVLLVLVMQVSSKTLLQKNFSDKYNQSQMLVPQQYHVPAQFLFLGLATLAGSYAFANLETTFRRHAASTGGAEANVGACGSSGCGSGCGGGGCGGCGGGD
jgi:uncharacterized protein (TIGR04222 family)